MAEKKLKLTKAQTDTLRHYSRSFFSHHDVRKDAIEKMKALGFIEVPFKEAFHRTYVVTAQGHDFLGTQDKFAVLAEVFEGLARLHERRYNYTGTALKAIQQRLLDRAEEYRKLAAETTE